MTTSRTSKPLPIDDLRVGLYEAARLIGKSIQHVRDLVRDGFVEAPVDGKYRAIAVASGALAARDDSDRRSSKSAAASELQTERAEEIRVRTAERLKTLQAAAKEEGIALVDFVLGPMRSAMQSVPARATSDIALRKRLESDLNVVLDEAADRAAAYRRVEAPRRELASNAATDKPRRVGKPKQDISAKRRRSRSA